MTFLLHDLNPYLLGLTPKTNAVSAFGVVTSLCVIATVVIHLFGAKRLSTTYTIFWDFELPALEPVPPQEQTRIMGTGIDSTDAAQGRVSASSPVQGDRSIRSHSPPGDIIAQVAEALPYVDITVWRYERDDWRLSDRLQVDPSDPSLVERVARKYTWKDDSLYDKNMQSLSPAQCYRAATIDGNNAIFIISKHEEEKLAAEGRFVNDKKILSLVSRVLDEPEPASPVKRLRFHSVSSEEL